MSEDVQQLQSAKDTMGEISRLRDEILHKGAKIRQLAGLMLHDTRRAKADDTTALCLMYANSMVRFAGTIDQSASHSSRILRLVSAQLEAESMEAVKKSSVRPSATKRLSLVGEGADISPIDSLLAMYGESNA